jgi:trimethylamine monooxygenase
MILENICIRSQSHLGTDEYGETIHNNMYRHLWTIGPKEAIESMDYSFKDHFGKDLPSFVPRDCVPHFTVEN